GDNEVTPFVQGCTAPGILRHVELFGIGESFAEILDNRGALAQHKLPVAKDWNLVPRVEPPEFLGLGLAGARLDRMKLVLESEFQQHPVGAHRAPGAGSPQSQIMRHDEVSMVAART